MVTPRRGKAVEINALWYNALRLMEKWVREQQRGKQPRAISKCGAAAPCKSFNQRFWYAEGGYLYDVVDGENGDDDPPAGPISCWRISLRHPVLEQRIWKRVFNVVRERLLTPVGLRSLAPGSSRLQSPSTSAIFERATPPITRAPSGPG